MTLVTYLILAVSSLVVGWIVGFWCGARLTGNVSTRTLRLAQQEQDRMVALYEAELAEARAAIPARPRRLAELVREACQQEKDDPSWKRQ